MKKSNIKGLKLRQLTASMNEKALIPINRIGQKLRDIREIIGMTQKQMAKRLKVSQSAISQIEENRETSKLGTILKVAGALECDLMGAVISKEPIEGMIRKRAERTAKKMLNRTFATMSMEKQTPTEEAYKYQLRKLTDELTGNPGPELWED
jgi:predicted DNA-binding mobile mystery protein A